MTSRSAGGIQRPHPPPLGGGAIAKAPGRASAFARPAGNGLRRPPETIIDLTLDADQSVVDVRASSKQQVPRPTVAPITTPKLAQVKAQHEPGSGRGDSEGREASQAPAKVQTSANVGRLRHDGETPSAAKAAEDTPAVPSSGPRSPPPLPLRPSMYRGRKGQKDRRELRAGREATKETPSMKPYVLEPPPTAPHLSKHKTSDFFPWTGNHAEDVLSENATKQGFYDKPPVSQSETGTAKPALLPIFKHKAGVHTLSSLFVSVLEQRQERDRVTAPSTFKPPPRVTLTDSKREAWLRDLANCTVPLRRLSRTIPHGIRGKVLLEQCLSKNIPTSRAVWLAKCVGANEIRAFKRKGVNGAFAMGGEAKYIRDWTLFVEQFIDHVISDCGTPNWKARVTYVIRLSSQFYAECLLDKRQYLNFILKSLEGSTPDTIPIWLLILQIYWEDMIRDRRYEKRLGEALLSKLHKASTSEDNDVLAPIVTRLSELVTRLSISRGGCFDLPEIWPESLPALEPLAPAIQDWHRRLDRLSSGSLRSRVCRDTPRRRIIQILDSASPPFHLGHLSALCSSTGLSDQGVILILLEWASSPYRHGMYRIYLTARLLRLWSRSGTSIQYALMNFLSNSKELAGLEKNNVYHVISELIRSRHFRVGDYLEWLIATGALRGYHQLSLNDPCDVRLLAEIPSHGLPAHVLNLRQTLLGQAGFHLETETQAINEAKASILKRFSGSYTTEAPIGQADLARIPPGLSTTSRAVKAEISRWLREQVVRYHPQKYDISRYDPKDTMAPNGPGITLSQFNLVRSILEEDLEDFSMLADILQAVASSEDPVILASIADTLNCHYETFAAIGAGKDLFERVLERYKSLRTGQSPERLLLVSLIGLGSRIPGEEGNTQLLFQDLKQQNQRPAVAACSPVSDHVVDALQSADSDFSEDIERLLSSGMSMDKHSLLRLFESIIGKMDSYWTKNEEPPSGLGASLSKLRLVNLESFDELIVRWLGQVLVSTTRPNFSMVLKPLISSGCITFSTVAMCSAKTFETSVLSGDSSTAARVALETLAIFTTSAVLLDLGPHDYESYRFKLEQQRFMADNPHELFHVIRKAIRQGSASVDEDIRSKLESLLASPSFISMAQKLVIDYSAAVQTELITGLESAPSIVAAYTKEMFDHLLDPQQCHDLKNTESEGEIIKIVQMIDDFNLPICQLRLQLVFARDCKPDSEAYAIVADSMIRSFFDAVESEEDGDRSHWASLLTILDERMERQIHEHAVERLLAGAPNGRETATASADDGQALTEALMNRYLAVIEATAYSVNGPEVWQLAPIITAKLNALESLLDSQTSALQSTSEPTNPRLCPSGGTTTALHPTNSTNINANAPDSEAQIRLSLAVVALLVDPHLQSDYALVEYIFDVAAALSDDLPQDTHNHIATLLKQHNPQDPRLTYLYASIPEPGDWLFARSSAAHTTTSTSSRSNGAGAAGASVAGGGASGEGAGNLVPFHLRPWEILPEPTPNVGINDTSLSLGLFRARKA
ncbi:MAG: hypothetical protein M1819_006350 [Sarea resinae]|nr:MAG: hypothetical protein M1819_006350 [Sarea resinae]